MHAGNPRGGNATSGRGNVQASLKIKVQLAGIVILGTVVLWKGIIPALTEIGSDFPNYYTASRLLLQRKDVSRIYADGGFQSQIEGYDIHQAVKFSPFPPVTAFVMLPLAPLPPLTALRIWTLVNVGALLGGIMLLSNICEKD